MSKLRKKELNINGVLFNIHSAYIDEIDAYFSKFIVPSNEEITSSYNIYFENDINVLSSLLDSFNINDANILHTFKNQIHYQIDDKYLINTREYMCIKLSDYNYILFGSVKGLSWIIRELLIREMEDKGYFYMHGTGLNVYDKGILLLGNSGSGKTTFMTRLNEINTKEKFISNDRVFVKDNLMYYYPLQVIYALGTVRSNDLLDKYFRETHILEKVKGKEYLKSSNDVKCHVPICDISKIFSNVENIDKSNIDLIIFPKLGDKEDYSYLDNDEIIKRLNETNFTPNDTENKRKEWLKYRKTTIEELEIRKKKLNDYLIKNTKIIEVNYKKDTNSEYIEKVLKKVL